MSRDSHLDKVAGLHGFTFSKARRLRTNTIMLLTPSGKAVLCLKRGPNRRSSVSRAGDNKPLYLDHPQFEGFEVRRTVGPRRRDTYSREGVRTQSMSVIRGSPENVYSGRVFRILTLSGMYQCD